ncbi:MAG TPA: TetR/AcrR family transcriptional regulator [Baekduia sp.]|nr:TetR/AcrR family transcriptional regulator [Baekduia sp.]
MASSSPELPMSAPPVAARERADARRNRERILCAAARLIEERGIEHVSMDDVACAAGVGKGTLYRRFGDRSALLRALIEEPERAFQESLIRGEAPLGPGAPPLQRLHAFGDALLDHYERHATFIRAADSLSGGRRYLHPVYRAYRAHVGVLLRELLGDGVRTEYLADALMAPLGAEPFLHQRTVLEMSLDEIRDGWHALVDAVCAAG